MGMFDDLKYKGQWYQTKDFDCHMDKYFIEDGRLYKETGHNEDRSPATAWRREHPDEELPEDLKGFYGIRGCITWVATGREDTKYHGMLNFYGEGGDFLAKFTDGQMVEIENLDDEPEQPTATSTEK